MVSESQLLSPPGYHHTPLSLSLSPPEAARLAGHGWALTRQSREPAKSPTIISLTLSPGAAGMFRSTPVTVFFNHPAVCPAPH